MKLSPKAAWFWSMLVIWLVIDQATKIWVYTNLRLGIDEVQVIPGFLSFIQAQNPGAAFSILRDSPYRHYVFFVFTLIAVGWLTSMYRSLAKDERLVGAAIGLIMSGALGNLIDRLHKGTVTDFIRVYTEDATTAAWLRSSPLGAAEWPTFNIADSTLLVGVVIFFVHGLIYGEPGTLKDSEAPEPEAATPGASTPEPASPPSEGAAS